VLIPTPSSMHAKQTRRPHPSSQVITQLMQLLHLRHQLLPLCPDSCQFLSPVLAVFLQQGCCLGLGMLLGLVHGKTRVLKADRRLQLCRSTKEIRAQLVNPWTRPSKHHQAVSGPCPSRYLPSVQAALLPVTMVSLNNVLHQYVFVVKGTDVL